MDSESNPRSQLRWDIAGAVLLSVGLPLLGLRVATSRIEVVLIGLASLLMLLVLVFVPWAKYRRLIGRPTRIDQHLPY